jgi:peptide deformylase
VSGYVRNPDGFLLMPQSRRAPIPWRAWAVMAANMIGIKKNIIAISVGLGQFVMINPVILKKSKPYDTEESCLSLLGGPRKCKRYEEIEVEYLDINWKKQRQKYSG